MTLAEKITHLRINGGMSQEQLATALMVARQSISKWEKGESYPQVDKIMDICKLFKVSADDLLNNEKIINLNKSPIVPATPRKNKYFGTDGFRGESNKTLNAMHAFKVGRFLGWYYSQLKFTSKHLKNDGKARIVIGKDTRRSSYMFEYALCAGIVSSGANAYILHVTTTPSVSYITRTEGFDCGVMITASHNVFYDNGIKVLNEKGEKLSDEVTALIEAYIDGDMETLGVKEDDIPLATRENVGSVVDWVGGRNRYIAYLISTISTSFRDLNIGLDCANGSSWMIAKNVFQTLGANVRVIGDIPDGLNTNLDCGSTHIEQLCQLVKDEHLDCGFAFDGDADRCLAVDSKGNVVDGDKILYILAKRSKSRKYLYNDTVVTTIMSNSGLAKALKKIGIKNVQTDVGDRFVYEEMMKNNYWLGGEQSGHIILRKYATTGDGILTSIKLVEEMIQSKASLEKLCEDVHLFPQKMKNVRVVDKNVVMENEAILAKVKEINKKLGEDGRILLRKSGTEPVIRIMVEAEDENLIDKYINEVYTLIQKGGYIGE